MEEPQPKQATEQGIFNLWFNWTISTGALTLLALLSLWVAKLWLPLVSLALFGILTVWIRYGVTPGAGTCRRVPWTVSRVVLVSTIIMLIINIAYVKGYVNHFFDPELLNLDHPYITILIIGPVGLVIGIAMYIRDDRANICQDCKIRYGQPSERGYLGRILTEESNYQLRFFIYVCALLSLESWSYYIFYYVNVNLNQPDHFFFYWVPLIIWALSIIYLGARYFTLWGYYYGNTGHTYTKIHERTTCVRFLVLSEDSIFLGDNENYPDSPNRKMADTPAVVVLPRRNEISIDEASKMFSELSGIPSGDFRIRNMYESDDMTGTCNIFHFIVNLEPEQSEKSFMQGRWYTIPQLQRIMTEGKLAPLMTTEINRLYTITMMWKTYTRDGRRQYRIKNYRPRFRINGIQDWDVDFNDNHWLYLARNNEDKPFFRLRRLWQRYVTGINRH